MTLSLRQVELVAGPHRILYPLDLELEPGSITTLLGPIRAGKTSLMRLMAGLDKATGGSIHDDGIDVTKTDVRKRSVSMVYQQFINYPNFTVYDNIASPLRVAGKLDKRERDRQVREIAERLGLSKLLTRLPAELSGGQQQRTALARAMVKDCRLLLLDEPLVNLDYKLREELRAEMKALFRGSDRIVVYATTEPQEALMLGGRTCVLSEGARLQDGPALDVYRRPATLAAARLISDPAMNVLGGAIATIAGARVIQLDGGDVLTLPPDFDDLPAGRYTFGLHAAQFSLARSAGAVALPVEIELAEINGSETLLHGLYRKAPVLLQMDGVHDREIGAAVEFCFDPQHLYAFDAAGRLARAPRFGSVPLNAVGGEEDGMARIRLHDVAHSYRPNPAAPSDYALRPVDLTWEDGGAYALLGPSGSGKSTLLNILSGLVRPSRGKLLFDDVDVTDRDTRQRNIAQVFQFPVIYDTMTVYQNLAFPLRNRGVAKAAIQQRVETVAAILDLTADLGRRASGLTADAKQRISMGRGLVRTDVAAILFDEPLTVIDPALKWQLRRKLKQIHAELKVTLIYVTHDQTEALTFADHVVVMDNGEVLQQGTPQELFEAPQHVFIGHFIGSPGMNLLACTLEAGGVRVDGSLIMLDPASTRHAPSGTLVLGIRPEFVSLTDPGDAAEVTVSVHGVEPLGGHQIIHARLGAETLEIKADPEIVVPVGQMLPVWLPRRWLRLYADGRLVA